MCYQPMPYPIAALLKLAKSSVTAMYAAENGWPFGEIKDDDPKIFEKETQIPRGNPVRDVSHISTMIT